MAASGVAGVRGLCGAPARDVQQLPLAQSCTRRVLSARNAQVWPQVMGCEGTASLGSCSFDTPWCMPSSGGGAPVGPGSASLMGCCAQVLCDGPLSWVDDCQ